MSRSKISYYLVILILLVAALQFSSFGIIDEIYSMLRLLLIGGIGVLFLISFKNPLNYYFKVPVFAVHFICLIFFSVLLFVAYTLEANVSFKPAVDLGISLMILMIGYNINISENQFKKLGAIFIILFTFSAISIIITFASGFIIHDHYLPIPKNQIAPVYGVAFIISLYFAFKEKSFFKWIYYILAGLLLMCLLVIRGRAVIVAVLFTTYLFLFHFIEDKRYRIIVIALILLSLPFVGQYIYDALFLNYDITDLDSISAGRMERNIMGLQFLFDNPLKGELVNKFSGGIIHNYILISLVSYGMILAPLLLVIYFLYIYIVMKAIRGNNFEYYEVGLLAMTILLIVSFFEYTYPYSPGSAVFFPFFLTGQFLRVDKNKQELENRLRISE